MLLLVALLLAADPAPAPPAPDVAATVNEEPIPLAEVDAAVKKIAAVAGALTPRQVKQLRKDVLADLVDDVLLRQHLRRHAPAVDPAEVDQLFKGLAASLQRQGKTPADYLRESGQTEAQARAAWADMIRFNRYAESLATDAELKKYFAAHRDHFDGTTVRAAHVVLRLPADAPPAERAAAAAKLTALRADIAAGKLTFAAAAKAHSVDRTAPAGGDLGWVGRRDAIVDPAVTAAAFALKPGEVSAPVDTEYGVHLVTAGERKAGPPVAFDQVADWVREAFLDDVRRTLVGQLRAKAVVSVRLPD